MEDVGIFYGHLVYFTVILVYFVAIWYIFPILEYCTKKNLATLLLTSLPDRVTRLGDLFTFIKLITYITLSS
jgi:hypothetical protein